jgi:NAD(P)H-dependent nitrite reductase small subunit
MTWTPITALGNIPLHEGRAVHIGKLELAIFHVDGRCFAIENACPHKGGPLCDGIIAGATVVCPLHGRRFDLESGLAVRSSEPDGVRTFPTRIENGIVYVDLPSPSTFEDHSTERCSNDTSQQSHSHPAG